jgi:aminoglycoside phosphotransferase
MPIIRSNYNKGIIDTSDLFRKFSEDNLDKLLHEVEDSVRGLEEDLVFTHGDYSLPNIIINDGSISGFIDLGNSGIADRYYDLAVAEKSIIRNFGEEYVELFFVHYGIDDIDYKKIRFYQLVEKFVWGT